ncbi:hypothetical protein [Butyrivibrio sp. MC2021]|uniref:hypothetical protein n=1 Tax=Butyrivibrio sp. MC2021 TaxID=1408306 RepID=UPI0012DF40AA|nr:hypothetical protein [Butyrivibrio sp. MC2021]
MGNTIRFNATTEKEECLSMSNQGTDLFLELLIRSSEFFEKTSSQAALIAFLQEQAEINDIAPGTAGFDIEEMPWNEEILSEDVAFLVDVITMAKDSMAWEKLGIGVNSKIMIPWLDRFEALVNKRISV